MTNEEILEKAMEKAVNNGWSSKGEWETAKLYLNFSQNIASRNHFKVIFRHDFAKAFWGEKWWNFGWKYTFQGTNSWSWWEEGDKEVSTKLGDSEVKTYLPAWQYHLQQMVLEDDPIKYLEKGL